MKIHLNLSNEDYKLLLDTIKFHEDNLRHKINWINDEIEYIKKERYNKEEEKLQIKYCEIVLEEIKNCNNLFKKIENLKNGKESFEITKDEYNELLKFIVEQIYHAKSRKLDFSEDRFGWGGDNCNILINQEDLYINVLMNIFNRYCGKHTYESILKTLE